MKKEIVFFALFILLASQVFAYGVTGEQDSKPYENVTYRYQLFYSSKFDKKEANSFAQNCTKAIMSSSNPSFPVPTVANGWKSMGMNVTYSIADYRKSDKTVYRIILTAMDAPNMPQMSMYTVVVQVIKAGRETQLNSTEQIYNSDLYKSFELGKKDFESQKKKYLKELD